MNDTYIVTTYVVIDDILKAYGVYVDLNRCEMPKSSDGA